MRPTDPRELLYPVLPPETYRELGIAPPAPPRPAYGAGGPVSAAGTPYLTGTAVTGPAGAGTVAAPDSAPPPPPFRDPTHDPVPPRRDRTLWIVAVATALIIAIIVGATWIILDARTPDDESQVRAAIAAETEALNRRDFTALLAVRCSSDVQMLEQQFTPQTFAAEIDLMIGSGGRWDVTVLTVAVDRAAGTATAEQTTVPVGQRAATIPQTVTDTATLRKESGGWKVCVSSSGVR